MRAAAVAAWLADRAGAAAAEFALVLPLMLLILFAILSLGLALYNYEMLTGGVRVGIRQFAIGRGATSPLTDAQTAIKGAVQPALSWNTLNTSTNLKFLVAPVGSNTFAQCTTDSACGTALVSGATAEVIASYPCTIIVMSINLSAGCTLSQTTQELVE